MKMPSDSPSHLDLVIDQLLIQARDDNRLAAILRHQARRILDTLDNPQAAAAPPPATDSPAPASSEHLDRLLAWSRSRHGRSASGMISIGGEPAEDADPAPERYQELADISRLKARAAAWRSRALASGDAPTGEREALIHEASDTGVFLWTVTRSQDGQLSRNAADYQRLADTYWACAEALDAWSRLSLDRARDILPLIAESQSMIRVAASRAGHRRREDTAEAVHGWLCEVAAEIQVYIPRFMKVGEAADPELANDLRQRVARLLEPAAPVAGGGTDTAPTDDDDDDDDEPPLSESVARVRELLRHRTVALFCGERRPEKRDKLMEAFELNDLLWDDVGDGYTEGDHEWIFNRPDLDLVLLAVRWLSHGHTDNLPNRAAERGVPVVWLKGGIGVNRVAHDILAQVSEQLTELG